MKDILCSYKNGLSAAVIGSSGGIGSRVLELLINAENVKKVYSFNRSSIMLKHPKHSEYYLDLEDELSILDAADNIADQTLDLLFLSTGMLSSLNIQPEKRIEDITSEKMLSLFHINTIGPALVGKHFLRKMASKTKSSFAVLSARVGSIEDNVSGGWYSYRASKAALNMILKNFSIEYARKNKNLCILSLQPGTVNTKLSSAFLSRQSPENILQPDFAAQRLLEVINSLSSNESGSFYDWQGRRIPW